MGEVWKARDSRLNRDVAIKISAEQFTDRFEREARSIAALNHSNICTLHDVGPNYLVMELVEGPTLAERIKRGPIPLEEAIGMARQIAEALEAAHEKGIVHRDLKPANIKIRPDGSVKVLDFGIAKAMEGEDHTMPGMVVGTPGYMSPEQARGEKVDKRTDIWAFGVVLYEMVAGSRLDGEPDWAKVPARIQRLLRLCLERDSPRRLRDISSFEFLVDSEALSAPSRSRLGSAGWVLAGLVVVAAAVLAFVHFREKPSSEQVLRFIVPPEKGVFSSVSIPAVSPDGRHVAYVTLVDGKTQLWVRDLDSLASRLLFTENARLPFWSPDSRTIGFFAGGKLRKIDASGGPALPLCDSRPYGGTWNGNGTILFTPSAGSPIFRVSAAGGAPVAVTSLDKASGEVGHYLPWFLPDGRHFLYTVRSNDEEKTAIYIGDLESRELRQLMLAKSKAIYARPGYLLFLREHTLMAQPFDAGKLQTTGDALPMAEQVDTQGTAGLYGQFSASQNGVLAYTSGAIFQGEQFTWFDRSGKILGTVGGPAEVSWPAISPDGKTVAFQRRDEQSGLYDIWLHDLARGTDSRFTFNSRDNEAPIWSPDGNYIAFSSDRSGSFGVYRKGAGGTGQDELVDGHTFNAVPTGWSPDGRYLLEEAGGPPTSADIWVAPMGSGSSGGKPRPYLQTEFNEGHGKVSPNGRWLTYVSDETKKTEVYVMTFPHPGGKWQISTNGGAPPAWSRDGRELFYFSADNKMMAVEIKASGNKLEAGVPHALFDLLPRAFDVSREGKFLIPTAVVKIAAVPMTVIVNWPAGLKK
jgi:Tol biopolymer transport system component